MLNPRYNYAPLSRDSSSGSRQYCLPDGSRVPSVTTILDKTRTEEKKQALANWKKRVGQDQAQQITAEASGRGTRMHKFLETYVQNNRTMTEPGTNPYSQQAHAMAMQIAEHGLVHVDELWGIEVPVYVSGLYAGTTDACGIYQGQPSIIDYKQSNKPKKTEWIGDYLLQLCAYAAAHNEVHGTQIKQGVILMAVAPQGLEKPKFQHWILTGSDWDTQMQLWFDRVEQYYKIR